MAYKTIVVHLNNDKRAPVLLAYGLELARRYDAHLIGLYVFPAVRLKPPVPLPFGGDVLAKIRISMEEDQSRVHEAFRQATANESLVTEWRSITTERRDPCDIVLEHARSADLVIASQTDPEWPLSNVLDFPERIAIECGRPVIVIPNGGKYFPIAKHITVAWANRRESARAVGDAMSLLVRAEAVKIVTVDEGDGGREGELPDTEIAAAIARHGVKCEVASIPRGAATTGEAIREYAVMQGSDLLVMGAYGHSRFREMAFGGVTRHLLREMTLPVLLAH